MGLCGTHDATLDQVLNLGATVTEPFEPRCRVGAERRRGRWFGEGFIEKEARPRHPKLRLTSRPSRPIQQ